MLALLVRFRGKVRSSSIDVSRKERGKVRVALTSVWHETPVPLALNINTRQNKFAITTGGHLRPSRLIEALDVSPLQIGEFKTAALIEIKRRIVESGRADLGAFHAHGLHSA